MMRAARADADANRPLTTRAISFIGRRLAVPVNSRVQATALEVNADPRPTRSRTGRRLGRLVRLRGLALGRVALQALQIENIGRLVSHNIFIV